jgi:hypothetical protein
MTLREKKQKKEEKKINIRKSYYIEEYFEKNF